jgi:hypothetical protein
MRRRASDCLKAYAFEAERSLDAGDRQGSLSLIARKNEAITSLNCDPIVALGRWQEIS